MKQTIKTICLCAVLVSALAVQAADVEKTSYFKLDAGLSLINDIEIKNPQDLDLFDLGVTDVKLKTDPGVRVDLAGGYNFSQCWALEIEGGFTFNSIEELEAEAIGAAGTEALDMDFFQIPLLVNVIYRLPLDSNFKPYLGAGVGGVWSIISGDDVDSENDIAFAFQGMAGVDYELNDNTDIGIGYKFLGALEQDFGGVKTENIYTHAILATFNFRF